MTAVLLSPTWMGCPWSTGWYLQGAQSSPHLLLLPVCPALTGLALCQAPAAMRLDMAIRRAACSHTGLMPQGMRQHCHLVTAVTCHLHSLAVGTAIGIKTAEYMQGLPEQQHRQYLLLVHYQAIADAVRLHLRCCNSNGIVRCNMFAHAGTQLMSAGWAGTDSFQLFCPGLDCL